MLPILHYLEFERLDDTDGVACFDALASVPPAQAQAVQDEIQVVLCWLEAQMGTAPGPLDEGAAWDTNLSSYACDGWQESGLTVSGDAALVDVMGHLMAGQEPH